MNTTSDSAGLQALSHSRERPPPNRRGYAMLLVLLLTLVLIGVGVWQITQSAPGLGTVLVAGSTIAFLFVLCGFYLLQPNQAAAILLFGAYKGTDRTNGLRWVLPSLTRAKIPTPLRNH